MGQVVAISKRSKSSLDTVAGHADRVYSVAEGATSPPGTEEVSSSWQRSANKYRVDPVDTHAPRILASGELKDFREPLDKLIFSAQEEIDRLYTVVREAGYTVLFCDSSGVAVEHRGDDAQASRFEYWGTWLGGVWSEEVEGTNGIGTCIVEERPVTVHRSQHFRSRHIDLSCSGAPVFGTDGRLIAVLDVSAIDPELSEAAHALTGALTVRSARAIEERFFREQFRREWIVAVAPPEGGVTGMLLAIDGNQRIVGANRAARTSLMLDDRGLRGGVSLWRIFERDLDLFRRKDRTDLYTRLVVAGSDDNRPALVTPPDHEANDAFLRMVGYDHEDIVSGRMRWTELTPPEWLDRDERGWLPQLKVTGSLQPFEKEYFRKDGSRVPVLIGVATFEGGGNQGVAFVLDLTERKRAEEVLRQSTDALRRSEAYLAEAQRLSHTGTWVSDGTLTTVYNSEENYRIWGFDPLPGLPSRDAMWQRIHPDDRGRVWEGVQEAVRQKRDYAGEFRIVLPDGTIKYLDVTAHHRFSARGEVVEVLRTNVDVTEGKRAERALRESEEKFRDYAETASDWFWETGPDYKFTLLSENAFGSDPADRIGTACWDHALDLETELEKWRVVQATLDSRKPFRDFVYQGLSGDGSPMYVKASGKPVFDANGEFRGYRGTGTDVTALMRAQEEHERLRQLESDLAHMNRLSMMGELAASLAHEVTQPIATARNNARAALNFLDKQPPDLGDVREALACVVGDADRAGAIIDRIRDHIKKVPPRRHRFDLNEAINEVIGLARSAIIRNGVSVQTRLTEGLAPVQGDRVQLQQVVLNLILNAVDAMSTVEAGPRELLISTEQTQTGGVLVSVRDSGPGIDPIRLEQVFEAFYTTKSSGVGMGLSICRSIIDAHGGRLWAEANEPRGAVFQFTLPRADRELTNFPRTAHQTGERREDTVSDAAHQLAYEGSKRPHRSMREPDQRHWGSQ